MDVRTKPKFIPKIVEEKHDINTILFIFAQIVAENSNTKKLLVYYYKKDNYCIFDGVKDLLLELLSIELRVVFIEKDDFYSYAMIENRPQIVFVDDVVEDVGISNGMVSTMVPNCFIISRGVNNIKLNEQMYLPLYTFGKGKEKLELARWNVFEHNKKLDLAIRFSVLSVYSEDDLDKAKKAIQESTMYRQLIIVTKYPDTFGLKKMVQEYRHNINQTYTYLIFSNTQLSVDKINPKEIRNADLLYNILNDGVWGGEYYLPVKNA